MAIGRKSPGQYARVAGPLNTAGCIIVGPLENTKAEVPLSLDGSCLTETRVLSLKPNGKHAPLRMTRCPRHSPPLITE